jgi:hypothetical protein
MEGRNYTDKIEELRSQMEEIRQHLVSNPQSNWSAGVLDSLKANLDELKNFVHKRSSNALQGQLK